MSEYKSLSTANLPDPVIDPAKGENPTDYFNTVTYSGTSGDKAVTGVGFQPDWVWIKQRNSAADHQLYDSVRGVTKLLESNQTLAEQTKSEGVKSFDSDGFTHGVESAGNDNSGTHVAWNWKAGGSGVSNTDGNVTSTVSADTTSGFSVVTWTGSESESDQIGHGLSQKPDLIIARRRDDTHAWVVWGEAIGTASNSRLFLNTNDVIGTTGSVGASTNTYFAYDVGGGESWLAYCFHSVEGFSKFGSYQGGSDPFVYLGFEPAMIIFKRSTGTTTHWAIRDNARKTDNPNRNTLYPSKTDAEYTGTAHDIDFLSNGFKIRNDDGLFDASATYIYAAWAKTPFKYGTGV
jgi:hypothetical protein